MFIHHLMHLTSEISWHNSSRRLPVRIEKFLNPHMLPPSLHKGKLRCKLVHQESSVPQTVRTTQVQTSGLTAPGPQ